MTRCAALTPQLFGDVAHGDFLDDDANFCSFDSSFMTMFRSATGESWNGIMHDVMVTDGDGCSEAEGNCGSYVAIPFFVSYTARGQLRPSPSYPTGTQHDSQIMRDSHEIATRLL